MKSTLTASQIIRVILSLALFALIAVFTLAYPVALHLPGSGYAFLRTNFGLKLATGFLYLAALLLLGRITYSLRDSPSLLYASYVLFAFILFFTLERLTCNLVLGPSWQWMTSRIRWIQIGSAMSVAIIAAAFFPHLQSRFEGIDARLEHDKFLAAAESSLDDFYIFSGIRDSSGNIVDFRFAYINPNAERRLHTNREKLIGKVLSEVRPFAVSSGILERYLEVVRTGVPYTTELFIDDEMIQATWIHVQAVKLGDGVAVTSRDFTERKRITDRVHFLAHYDPLTELANRTLLQSRLDQAIVQAQQDNQKVAVFMIDVDNFKSVNDSLGHSAGDLLLQAVGKRLLSSVRETDTVARMGGDEFVIVIPNFKSLGDIERFGLQIVEAVDKPISIGDHELNVTVSIGLSIYPDGGLDAEQLLKNADSAMYTVKDTGRNGLHLFSQT